MDSLHVSNSCYVGWDGAYRHRRYRNMLEKVRGKCRKHDQLKCKSAPRMFRNRNVLYKVQMPIRFQKRIYTWTLISNAKMMVSQIYEFKIYDMYV